MRTKKSQVTITKTTWVGMLLVFYALIFTLVGLAFSSVATIQTTTHTELSGFFGNVITGITEAPTWLNLILFSSLAIMLTFIIVTSLPTFNGGS